MSGVIPPPPLPTTPSPTVSHGPPAVPMPSPVAAEPFRPRPRPAGGGSTVVAAKPCQLWSPDKDLLPEGTPQLRLRGCLLIDGRNVCANDDNNSSAMCMVPDMNDDCASNPVPLALPKDGNNASELTAVANNIRVSGCFQSHTATELMCLSKDSTPKLLACTGSGSGNSSSSSSNGNGNSGNGNGTGSSNSDSSSSGKAKEEKETTKPEPPKEVKDNHEVNNQDVNHKTESNKRQIDHDHKSEAERMLAMTMMSWKLIISTMLALQIISLLFSF